MKRKISILGCGWLGLPLAQKLTQQGWLVYGSTTKSAKLNVLAEVGIQPFLINLKNVDDVIDREFLNVEILFVNVPPGRSHTDTTLFLQEMETLIHQIESSTIREVILISSTSVYPDIEANIQGADRVIPDHILIKMEDKFLRNTHFRTSIIRFAGLIGPKRFPGRFLSGKVNLPNPLAPVNLIHLDDCLGIIERLLAKQIFGNIYHAATPDHPTKKIFYETAASVAGLPLPQFAEDLKRGKTIDSSKLMADLDYQFIHADLLRWLKQVNPNG